MTQQELGERAGVTRQTILSIEKGRYNPSIGLALRLAAILGVPVEELFSLAEDETAGVWGGGDPPFLEGDGNDS